MSTQNRRYGRQDALQGAKAADMANSPERTLSGQGAAYVAAPVDDWLRARVQPGKIKPAQLGMFEDSAGALFDATV